MGGKKVGTSVPVDVYQSDPMLKQYYDAYVVRGEVPTRPEVFRQIHFLTTFSIGCAELGCTPVRDVMNTRLNLYIALLRAIGFTAGLARKGKKLQGLEDIIAGVAERVRLDLGRTYRECRP